MNILLDFPMPIKTERLIIRPVMPGDGKNLFEMIEESRNELEKWLPWTEKVKHWEDSEKTARMFYADFIIRKVFRFLILQNNRMIGGCSLHRINWEIPSADTGYYCRTSEQGKGYIREAIAALTVFGFNRLGLRRLTITCDDENLRSAHVAESLGFILESKAKGFITKPGTDELRISRCYVRFNTEGLEK